MNDFLGLANKTVLVLGVANKKSVAYHVAQTLEQAGAKVVYVVRNEARRQGVTVFCLTVDREAPRYASRIFGGAGFAVLHKADQLPVVLIDVLRQLVRG